jgi:shikimate kinase
MPSAPEPPEKPIVLVGLMGAGKSTVGRRLAKRLGLPFADADAEIEAAAGLSIAALFEAFGEAHFRERERRVIVRLVESGPAVIATGGGAFIDPDTRALILSRCTAVWLDGDVDLLAERAARRGGRPLIEGKDPRAVLRALALARNPIYAEAHCAVRGSIAPHARMVDQIVAALAAR